MEVTFCILTGMKGENNYTFDECQSMSVNRIPSVGEIVAFSREKFDQISSGQGKMFDKQTSIFSDRKVQGIVVAVINNIEIEYLPEVQVVIDFD